MILNESIVDDAAVEWPKKLGHGPHLVRCEREAVGDRALAARLLHRELGVAVRKI